MILKRKNKSQPRENGFVRPPRFLFAPLPRFRETTPPESKRDSTEIMRGFLAFSPIFRYNGKSMARSAPARADAVLF